MTNNGSSFEALGDEETLGSCLIAAATRKKLTNVFVGLQVDGRRLFAATDESLRLRLPCDMRRHTISAGCFAKPITATLMAAAVVEHRVSWTDSVSHILAAHGTAAAALSNITVRHLLNHTHGLDASLLEAVPRSLKGLVDVQRLCEQFAQPAISPPGELYSYGNAGVWLAGALLETLYSRRYARVLADGPLATLGFEGNAFEDKHVCPATGGEFALSISQWLSFLEAHCCLQTTPFGTDMVPCLTTLQNDRVPLPGWSPAEQAACLGWKYYGEGWFGHNAYSSDSSALLRFHPEQQVALVLSAPGVAAFAACAAVFGELLPEFAHLVPPRLLKQEEREHLQLNRFTGVYAQARSSIEIEMRSPDRLLFAVRGGSPEHDLPRRALRPAATDIFIPESRDAPEFAFIQFVRFRTATECDYLWNGKQLWRKV